MFYDYSQSTVIDKLNILSNKVFYTLDCFNESSHLYWFNKNKMIFSHIAEIIYTQA